MKRSDINQAIARTEGLLSSRGIRLPAFASWTPEDWLTRGRETTGLIKRGLGWDVTDFGLGNFRAQGLVLFTLRNGSVEPDGSLVGTPYAEKVMVIEPGQSAPMHFHWRKTEDVVNRSGGVLAIRVYRSTEEAQLADESVSFVSDGQEYAVPAGHVVSLEPGESITIPAGLYHSFWALGNPVVVGEVSTVNDDEQDNHFLEATARFPVVEEDEPPTRLLVSDYASML